MTIWRILVLSAGGIITSTIASHAGPCSQEIDSVQARVDARLAASAAAGPSAPESPAAKLHRQPTPNSIEAAGGKLREEAAQVIRAAMARAREADQAGDLAACQQALAQVQGAIGQ